MAGVTLAALTCHAAPAPDLGAEFAGISSRVQSMTQGFYPEREWQAVLGQLGDFERRAAEAGNADLAVQAVVLRAAVAADVKNDHTAALDILRGARTRYDAARPASMRQVFARMARCYAALGEQERIQALIAEYKASPYYDPQDYAFSGGWGREVPLTVVRPGATESDSVTVTALNVARTQSSFAPGRMFPDFRVNDSAGRAWSLDDFRGKVLLVDVWVRDWTPWKRDLPSLKSLYERYHLHGFEIVGINADPVGANAVAYAAQSGMNWPQVVGDATVPRALGLYGECANFLIDGNGMIIGRNLRGSELVAAVKQALGLKP
jgi:peroxiredoxin